MEEEFQVQTGKRENNNHRGRGGRGRGRGEDRGRGGRGRGRGDREERPRPKTAYAGMGADTEQKDPRQRIKSDVSADPNQESCILCFNAIQYFAVGSCNHKNVCHKCVLRVRLLMKDKKCSMCKTELEEILITSDPAFMWSDFDDSEYIQDKEDESVYYVDGNAKHKGMELRSLKCVIYGCQSS